jgi:hypothetical protein
MINDIIMNYSNQSNNLNDFSNDFYKNKEILQKNINEYKLSLKNFTEKLLFLYPNITQIYIFNFIAIHIGPEVEYSSNR